MNVWGDTPMFLLATSPGGRGGKGVLSLASSSYRRSNKSTIAEFSLPSFNNNFNTETGINEETLKTEFNNQLKIFAQAL